MSLFAKFAAKTAPGFSRDRVPFTLNEILAIVDMQINGGLTKEQISAATGRSVNSLNYKFFEGKTTIKNKTQVRSIRRYFYAKPNDPMDNTQVDPQTALQALYKDYGATWVDDAEMEARIDAWKAEHAELLSTALGAAS